jgi:RimJ/RimL family protein N-acetyltransferase
MRTASALGPGPRGGQTLPERSTVFETERLVVRTAAVEDADLIYELWTDPRVMAYVGFPDGLLTTREEIKARIQSSSGSEFDRLLIVGLKPAGQPIGQCLMHRPEEQGIAATDVKLLPAFWGFRYGAEVQCGQVAYLFAHTGCVAVEGTPNVENLASIKMQEAAGAERVGEAVYEFPESMREYTTPVHHYIYRIYRSDWELRQGS